MNKMMGSNQLGQGFCGGGLAPAIPVPSKARTPIPANVAHTRNLFTDYLSISSVVAPSVALNGADATRLSTQYVACT